MTVGAGAHVSEDEQPDRGRVDEREPGQVDLDQARIIRLDGQQLPFERDPAGWRLLCAGPSADPIVAAVQRRTRDEILALTVETLKVPDANLAIAEALRNAINGLFGWRREHPDVTHGQLIDAAVLLTWRGLGP